MLKIACSAVHRHAKDGNRRDVIVPVTWEQRGRKGRARMVQITRESRKQVDCGGLGDGGVGYAPSWKHQR